MKNTIAFIIPTRNRLDLLVKTIKSIENQTVLPNQIIIVDGSDNSLEKSIRDSVSFDIQYIYVNPPGLTKQRNAGIAVLKQEITLAGYLDDDVELYPDAVEKMLDFWNNTSERTGGTSFNIVNNPVVKSNWSLKLFGLTSNRQGVVLRSGFAVPVNKPSTTIKVEWLCGGATIWRKSVLENNKYDEWFAGTAYVEDVDFSYRVGKQYDLFVVNNACLDHNPPPFHEKNAFNFGQMTSMYIFYFVKKHFGVVAYPAYCWAIIGKVFGGILTFKKISFDRSMGFLYGLLRVIMGKSGSVLTNFRK